MAVIFQASGDANSGQTSSRFFGPLLEFFFPGLSSASLNRGVFLLRKLAHVVEYAVLAGLLWRAFRGGATGWRWWPDAALAFALATAYAITDEWHQTHIPNRQGTITDVLIDTAGALMGLGLIWLLARIRQSRNSQAPV